MPPFFCSYLAMKAQNFKNHARYYPFHHFIITPISLVVFVWTLIKIDFSHLGDVIYYLLIATLLVFIPFLARIYALKLQNRIILNEMRMRYFLLTGKSFEEKENKLRLAQVIALRFAGDEEFLDLIEKSISEKLDPKSIKASIKNWKGDYRRV